MSNIEIFVPGRICLFGEHSDWAGGYRVAAPQIEPGLAIVAVTNQGLYARAKPHPNKLIIRSTLDDGRQMGPIEVGLDPAELLQTARGGGFFSYAAGTMRQLLLRHDVGGIDLDNHRTDLPIQKGLSSSAALCVLLTRALNRLYRLDLTVAEEMELAYLGEISTRSQCGRMDQGCAHGQPIMMRFDGDDLQVTPLHVATALHLVIVDLGATKDTRRILDALNCSFPATEGEIHENVRRYLGVQSAEHTQSARQAIHDGDREALGRLMRQTQAEFDRDVQPACPEELTAPILHRVLSYAPIQTLVLGGKGVGSQGDGSAQLLTPDSESQKSVIQILERELGLSCLELTIPASRGIRKAVIPLAGRGTRLFPASKATMKELFPIMDRDGTVKPVLLLILEEALSAGIESFCLIIQERDRPQLEALFSPPSEEFLEGLPPHLRDYALELPRIREKLTFVTQDEQRGFGHAVLCAEEWAKGDAFLLMLGDHLYRSNSRHSCASQLLRAHQSLGRSVVGLRRCPAEDISLFGCVGGSWLREQVIVSIECFAEKPSLPWARQHLRTPDLGGDYFLSLFGLYALDARIFDFLNNQLQQEKAGDNEIELTTALEELRATTGFSGAMIDGEAFDMGVPAGYHKTMLSFGAQPPD